ncbi:MAG: hypothetical protein RBG13Loki_3751 [Promethearchaeota archaeon CR_4]|nr:MAG: hypothetical protein RBG13Loki_3751 [Candidatus Lokiarchaeota archaeon CR_4]
MLFQNIMYVVYLVACYLIALNVLRKNPKNRENQMLCTSFILLGSFGTCILIYSIFNQIIIILIFSRLAYICAGFSMYLLYLVFGTIAHSKEWRRTHYALYLVILVVYSIVFFAWPGAVGVIDPDLPLTYINEVMLGIIFFLVIFFLINTLVYLWKYGIVKTEGKRKARMKEVFVGVLLSLIALVFGGIEIIFLGNIVLYLLLDGLFLATLALSIFIIGRGFIKSSE